eukprot:TRINITY_DN48682_c0_g1_i1.p1 TRINITY_DN48682_c0_g1~~TRINITY_DN48682_c0_g1_i1.p1  ORF type:complete len:823 (+),score=148.87 TRINITY_DN48682_c0_g1_i1:41-2509(+)
MAAVGDEGDDVVTVEGEVSPELRVDVEWPSDIPFDLARHPNDARSFLTEICESLISRGVCVVQMASSSSLREEARLNGEKMRDVEWLRRETEDSYLGKDNMTLVKELPFFESETPDISDEAFKQHEPLAEDTDAKSESSWFDPDLYGSASEDEEEKPQQKPSQSQLKVTKQLDLAPLRAFDAHLVSLTELLAYSPEAFAARGVYDRNRTLVRIPHMAEGESLVGHAGPMDEQDVGMPEHFLTWLMQRRLCLFYNVDGQGILDLGFKKADSGPATKLILREGMIVLFRADLLDYKYVPEDDSLVLQTWLLDAVAPVQFRTLATPPGTQGCDRVHVKSMTERFPAGCDGCDMTWALFTAGTDAQIEPPITRFDKDLYYIPERDAAMYGKAYIMHGALVNEESLIGFDNDFFGIDLEEAQAIAPSQRWVMEVGYETLWKGGWTKKSLKNQRIGTFMGDSGSEWNLIYLRQDKYQLTCNNGFVTISRLAHCLGLTGPTVSVDTACSASLVATNAAAHMMIRRHVKHQEKIGPLNDDNMKDQAQLKYALCMGVLCMVHPAGWIGECAATMLSYKGRAFTFDKGADGFIRGEGCCSVHIAAENDGERSGSERTLAVIMGSCANQDGRSASLTAPHGPSQQMCIRASLREAQLEPGQIAVGECHGTGTALGDPIEVGAMKSVQFGKRGIDGLIHCSAKSNVGHEEANAGICGLIKVVLILNAGCSSPNPHLTALNPHLDVTAYPVLFCNEFTTTGKGDNCAGVSSFGFGGTNSRADLWADVDKGSFKNGSKLNLHPADAQTWIRRWTDAEGGEVGNLHENFFLKDKGGH